MTLGENFLENRSKSLLAIAAPETSFTELELRQTFKKLLKWRKIFKRKINKLKKRLKFKLKDRNKLEIQQVDLQQEYKRLRKRLKKQKLEILLKIMHHLKYLRSMAQVIKSAQKIYLQERKAYRKKLLKVEKKQENTLKIMKPKVQSLEEQLNEINTEIKNLKRNILYYRQKADEVNSKMLQYKAAEQLKSEQKAKNLENDIDTAKIVYGKASETNIVCFQKLLSDQELTNVQPKSKDDKKVYSTSLERLPSKAKSKDDMQKYSDKNSSKKKSKSKTVLRKNFSATSESKMVGDFTADSTVLQKKSKKGLTKSERKSADQLPTVNFKPVPKKRHLRKPNSNVLYVSKEAFVLAPLTGTMSNMFAKPIDKTTMESITLPTKSQGFQPRSLIKQTSLPALSPHEDATKSELIDEQAEEIEAEEQTSLSEFISLYNVHDQKTILPGKIDSSAQLPKIREEKRPTLSFGEKFFRDLVKTRKGSIRQKLILEREQQKKLERELAEQREREMAEAIKLKKRSSSLAENKLDKLVRLALQSTFRHADVIRKDLPIVDEHILKTFKRKHRRNLMGLRTSQKFDLELEDDIETEQQARTDVYLDKTEYQSEEEETAPGLTAEEVIKRYFAQLKEDKKKISKKKKRVKRLKKRQSKRKQILVIPEKTKEPKLVCSCCGMITLQVGDACTLR